MAMILMVSWTCTVLVFEHAPDIHADTVSRDATGRYVVTLVAM